MENQAVETALQAFDLGEVLTCETYGSGHINDTYLLTTAQNGITEKYILQRMNHSIFKNIDALMENVVSVTDFLKEKISRAGGDPKRETLNVIRTRQQKPYYLDPAGEAWRMYRFVEDTFSLNAVRGPEDFFESAVAFGRFQYMLSDYPVETLHDTIPDFHHTPKRFARFLEVLKADPMNRAADVQPEIDFILSREAFTATLITQIEQGILPLRVTHNDTKLNNILLDAKTGKGLCIIDLDTVMPGLSAYDFGDAIRFGASTAAEDETDLSHVSFDKNLYALYLKGFLTGCAGILTRDEILSLPVGAKMLTLENGIRFLTDYLEGDVYYKIHRPAHNLDRARTQLKLVADMEEHWDFMMQEAEKSIT